LCDVSLIVAQIREKFQNNCNTQSEAILSIEKHFKKVDSKILDEVDDLIEQLQELQKELQHEKSELSNDFQGPKKKYDPIKTLPPTELPMPHQKVKRSSHIKQQTSQMISTTSRITLQQPPEKIYFNWDDINLPCISEIFQELRNHFYRLERMPVNGSLDQPCILFNFVAINSRIDHESLPQNSRNWHSLSGGNSVIVRVHSEHSSTFDVSLDSYLNSSVKGNSVVLKIKFKTSFDHSGMGEELKQSLVDLNNIKQQIIELIMK